MGVDSEGQTDADRVGTLSWAGACGAEGTLDAANRGSKPRQALFNVLEHAPWSPGLRDRHVLDLFAGSGALGLEALSRGRAVLRQRRPSMRTP